MPSIFYSPEDIRTMLLSQPRLVESLLDQEEATLLHLLDPEQRFTCKCTPANNNPLCGITCKIEVQKQLTYLRKKREQILRLRKKMLHAALTSHPRRALPSRIPSDSHAH